MYFILSWRNLWRNKRRTLIAAASVFFAVLLACLMRSGQLGSYSYMIHSSAKLYTGYLQVQGKGYWENRSLDRSIIINDTLLNMIKTTNHVTSVNPRLEGYALISNARTTKVSQIIGIDPESEDQMTGLKKRLKMGAYLKPDSDGALIGEGLAEMLKVAIGDSIVLYGQGFHGQIAAARIPVIGFAKMPFEDMNNGMVFLSLSNAQEFFLAPDRITSLALMVDNIEHLEEVISVLNSTDLRQFSLMTWDEMMPDLLQNIQVDNASGLIMIAILYIVIAFGIFGTVMMMISERLKEFGILISVGMKKWKLIVITTIETVFVALLGVFAGIIGSIPLVFYFYQNPIKIAGDAGKTFDQLGIEPIMNFSMDIGIFSGQALVVFLIALLTALYPIIFVLNLEPVKALRA
jgi:ABC-type lipoprotein release transport system permease subunit